MKNKNGDRKFLFICETPLQVLNACRFVLSNSEGSADCSDICVFRLFRTAEETAAHLRNTDIFRRVTEISAFPSHSGIAGKISTLCRMLMPKHTVKKYAAEMGQDFLQADYSHVVLCHTTPTARAVRQCFPKAEFLLLEDGTGSYVGNILEDQKSGMLKAVERIFPHMGKMFLPKAQYLSNKDIYIGTLEVPVCQLPPLSEANIRKVAEVFSYRENTFYGEAEAVFLSQPLEHLGAEAEHTDAEVQALLHDVFDEKAVIRVHPRQSDMQPLLKRDTLENIWELECMRQIESRHILAAYCSTAQFMPKILRNEEPILIFLYKLYAGREDAFSARFEKLIRAFQTCYTDPTRISVPETVQELEIILKKQKDKGNESHL